MGGRTTRPDSRQQERSVLERRWQQFVDGDDEPSAGAVPGDGGVDVRAEVLASWRRSARALDPGIDHAPFEEDATERWAQSRLAVAFEAVADELTRAALDGDLVAAVTDEHGTIVWTAGSRFMRRRAEQVAFVPGGRWDEASVGTNALALALRDGRPATVWSAEHFAPIVHDWVCYSAPIIDPRNRRTLGVLDLSTTWTRSTPLALTTVHALARLMSFALGEDADGPVNVGQDQTGHVLELRTLGQAHVVLDGASLLLAPRHVELLAVLSLAPDGLSLEQLHDQLHGDGHSSPNSTKAELSHLRRVVGDLIASRPYRLDARVTADHLLVVEALQQGRLDEALAAYGGPMLARSSAPAIDDQRRLLEVALRTAVLADGDADRLVRLSELLAHDGWVQETTLARLGDDDPRRSVVAGRLGLLR